MTPSQDLYALTDAQKQLEITVQQNAELWQRVGLLEKRIATILMCIEGECNTIDENLKALQMAKDDLVVAMRGNYVEADAVLAIEVAMGEIQISSTRLRAWPQGEKRNGKNGGNGHQE